jgi:hypothetical protein
VILKIHDVTKKKKLPERASFGVILELFLNGGQFREVVRPNLGTL